MHATSHSFLAVLAISSAAAGQSRVIITEIMYNPASNEKNNQTEWVEIANVGSEPIEIKDWRLDDEDKTNWGKFSCTLTPGGVAVLVNSAAVNEEQFRAAWDPIAATIEGTPPPSTMTYQIIPVKWSGISNTPKADDEVLRLVNDKDEVICEVKQEGEWPSCKKPDGSSIYLTDVKAPSISDGTLWKRSATGADGCRAARQTDIFAAEDIGSPGFVPGLSESAPPAAGAMAEPEDQPAAKTDETIDH